MTENLIDIHDREQVLSTLELCAYAIVKIGLADEETADTLGRINSVINTLGSYKRSMLAETDTKTVGEAYKLVPDGRICKRSYSSAGIFTAFMDAMDVDLTGVLFWLKERDALRLTWRWSQLQQAFDAADVGMKIQKHEITDEDMDWHVGEVWSDKPFRLEAIKGDSE